MPTSYPLRYGAAFIAAMLLETTAKAQTAPTTSLPPTGDQRLYGKHSPWACSQKTVKHGSAFPEGDSNRCLSRRERRLLRQQYQDQHRSEFPAIYYPGTE